MLLATPVDVLDMLGMPSSSAGSLAVARAALLSATVRVENYIESSFESAFYQDFFPGGQERELRLSTGFIIEGSVSVAYLGETIPATQYEVDYLRGTVTLGFAPSGGDSAIAITYEAGLQRDSDDLYESVPEALKRAAMLQAAKTMALSPSMIAKERVKITRDIINSYAIEAVGLQNKYVRPRSGLCYPSRTVKEPLT